MLTTIHITVRDRVPTITAGEDVISHNSDYLAEFEFDEEWQDKIKTVYFVCEDGSYQAVVMSGNSCGVPMLDGEHRRIFVGVQAGAAEKPSVLKTTRPCCLKVKDSIADYLGQPIPDPTPDVYEQIIAMLNNLTSPTWDAVQNKPFSTLGSGLEVDENGVLSAQGGSGGSADNVRIIDATDDIWKNGEHPLNMTTEEYQNILEWYRNQQSGVAKNILLNIDNRLVFQLVYIDGTGMTFIYSNSGYNRYIKVRQRSNEVIAITSDIAGLTKSLMEVSYLCNTGHKDDIIELFNRTTVGVIRGEGDSVPDNGKSIRYPALVFFGDEISYGTTYATLIDRNGVMWSIYMRLSSGKIEVSGKTGYVTNTALTDILRGYVSVKSIGEFTEWVANSLNQKLDKNQGADNAGKILGVGEDGIVVPQDKPTGGSVTVDSELSSTSENPVQNKVVTAALTEKITAPTTAAVGQIIKVKSVDSTGKPTEWEAADLSSGDKWGLITSGTIAEDASLTVNKDSGGKAFGLKSCQVVIAGAVTGIASTYMRFSVSGENKNYHSVEMPLKKENPTIKAVYYCINGEVPMLFWKQDVGTTAWTSNENSCQFGLHGNQSYALDILQHKITSIYIGNYMGNGKLAAGTKYEIYGVRV